jgi:PKD repeat protein
MNNDITGSYVAGVNANCAVSGVQTVTIANNHIMNGKTGYAVKNCDISKINLFLTHNYIYGNPVNFYPSSLADINPATSPNSKNSSGNISVLPQPLNLIPVAAFSASTTLGAVSLKVQFTDKSTNSPTAWKWNFGDKSTSTAMSPTHKYTTAGKYTFTLTVKNAAGSSIATKTSYIVVS